ncbi:MAG: DUF541 domain-containing protein [Balneolaceae bacterium]|nr:DUF541 domain-containing protein [Balneolaceae bacterium]
MKKLTLLFFALTIISCNESQDPPSIQLNVDQKVRIPIEYISISAQVQVNSGDPVEAEQKGYKKLADVVKLLQETGYEREQLIINSGNISDHSYRDNKRIRFSSSLNFDLYETDKLDALRKLLVKAGATNFNIQGYHNSKEDSLFEQAYHQAIEKARTKVDRFIADENLKTGKIINLSEGFHDLIVVSGLSGSNTLPPPPLSMPGPPVDPLFQKEYYHRDIEFTIKFELKGK